MGLLKLIRHPRRPGRPGEILRRVARTYWPWRHPIQTVRLPWGVPIRIRIDERIGRHIWQYGLYDLSTCEVLWRLLDPGQLAADVGANLGQMTGLLARRTGSAGRVWAFEPHPEVYQDLLHNVALCQTCPEAGAILPRPVALSDRPGTGRLVWESSFAANRGLAHLGDAGTAGAEVPLETLDNVVGDATLAVLKLDVEGHEAAVLQGAGRLLAARRIGHIVFESNDGPDGAVHRLLAAAGYALQAIQDWRHSPPLLTDPRATSSANFLATLTPAEALRRCAAPGWQVLGTAD